MKPKWKDAPEWARCRVKSEDGAWRWLKHPPKINDDWIRYDCRKLNDVDAQQPAPKEEK